MKKTILTIALLIAGLTISAQTVNNILIEDIPSAYIELTPATKKGLTVISTCDYGQLAKLMDTYKIGVIKNSEGKPMVFNGATGLLNFFESKGFEFVSRYPSATGGYTYLLKKSN